MFKSKPSQPSIDNKIGLAADATPDPGIIGAVSTLPQSVTNAAVQVLKFVNPTQPVSSSGDSTGSQTYSEVVTGVDPTYAALGVLTTGALASVAYSYVASDSDIATSATNLALGAVDAIARNDVVQNIANNDIVTKLSNNEMVQKAKHALSQSKFIQKATSALESITSKIRGEKPTNHVEEENYYNLDQDYINQNSADNQNINLDYYTDGFPATWNDFQTNFEYYQEVDYSDRYPYQESQTVDRFAANAKEAADIEFYEPTPTIPEKVPYVQYTEDHNPWLLLNTGQSTEHLYRGFS